MKEQRPAKEKSSAFGKAKKVSDKWKSHNDPNRKPGSYLFKAGHHIGRPKGSSNLVVRDLKKGLIEAAVMHGYDGLGEGGLVGYLYLLAEKQQRTFGGLLAKLMPLQMTGNVGLGITAISISPVPTDSYVSADEAKKAIEATVDVMNQAVIEHVESDDELNDEDEDEDEDERLSNEVR